MIEPVPWSSSASLLGISLSLLLISSRLRLPCARRRQAYPASSRNTSAVESPIDASAPLCCSSVSSMFTTVHLGICEFPIWFLSSTLLMWFFLTPSSAARRAVSYLRTVALHQTRRQSYSGICLGQLHGLILFFVIAVLTDLAA